MLFIEPHAGIAPVVRFVRAAHARLDINTYLLTDRRVLNAVRAAIARGVRVRIIIARHPYGRRPRGELTRLRATGAVVRYAPPRFTSQAVGNAGRYVFDHAKYMVAGNNAEIGTANMTWSAFHKNREYLWVGHDPRIAEALRAVFYADWTRRHAGAALRRVLVLSPGATGALVRLLRAPGRVCVGGGRETDRDEPSLRVSEAGNAAAPVRLRTELPLAFAGDPLAVPDEPRADATRNHFVAHPGERVGHRAAVPRTQLTFT